MSAFAFRFIIVFHYIDPALIRPVWYVGVAGYTLFFFFRFEISRKRKKAINNFHLLEKISAGQCLEGEDREAAKYLFTSISKSKEDINYLVIFALSVITVAIDLILKFWSR
jgi:hypothetical protein